MVEITGKPTKIGNSYWVLLPKALIDCKVIDASKEVTLQITPIKKGLLYNLAITRFYTQRFFCKIFDNNKNLN